MLNKYKREKGLEGVFYIVDLSKGEDKQWWQLRLKENHYVVSAVSSKEDVLRCLHLVCMTYKTDKGLSRALRHCDKNMSKELQVKCQKEYESVGKVYSDLVEEVVTKAKTTLGANPTSKPKLKKISGGSLPVIEEKIHIEEVKEVVIVTPLIKKKRKVGLLKFNE